MAKNPNANNAINQFVPISAEKTAVPMQQNDVKPKRKIEIDIWQWIVRGEKKIGPTFRLRPVSDITKTLRDILPKFWFGQKIILKKDGITKPVAESK